MTAQEKGFLLLTSHLGDPQRKVLTLAQMRFLAGCVAASSIGEREGTVTAEDLMSMGFNRPSAHRILDLLSQEEQLQWYLEKAAHQDCAPLTRISEKYPLILRKRLGLDSPGCLWTKGDLCVLDTPMIALVGSRDLREENRGFAENLGRQAAEQGITLVSGNARGADRTAQDACIAAGGRVISVVSDALTKYPLRKNVLYISEDGYDIPFSSQRALSRNRVIHGLGYLTFVAQSALGQGGTWHGTLANLKWGWSPVLCFNDGSEAFLELTQRGAGAVTTQMLHDIGALQTKQNNFFDQ